MRHYAVAALVVLAMMAVLLVGALTQPNTDGKSLGGDQVGPIPSGWTP